MDLLEKQAIRSFEKHQDLFPPLQTVTQMTAKATTLSDQEIQHSFQTLSEMMEKIRQEEKIVSIQFQELVSLHKQHQGSRVVITSTPSGITPFYQAKMKQQRQAVLLSEQLQVIHKVEL